MDGRGGQPADQFGCADCGRADGWGESRRQSDLHSLLERASRLPVETVSGQVALQNNVLYVVPDRHTVSFRRGGTTLGIAPATAPTTIDAALATAAVAFGEGAIAVIQVDSADGLGGLRSIKEAGGTVILPGPGSNGTPLSLVTSLIDIVADPGEVGLLVQQLVGRDLPMARSDEQVLWSFPDQVCTCTGVDFNAYKRPTILRRLQRRLTATNCSSLPDYAAYLLDSAGEYQHLVRSFLIQVTEFFRDPEMFAYLPDTILPEVIDYAKRHTQEIRLWSAGCATGEEAYSLAILLAELLGDEVHQFNVRIFATDIDNDAVSFARRGIYAAAALTGLSNEMVARYFTEIDGEYEVAKAIRSLMIFGQHDLGTRAPFPRVDLTLCRNVLIYFTPELQRRALQLFAFSLRDGGRLILGKSESSNPLAEYFTLEHARLKVYRREGGRALIPPTRLPSGSLLSAPQPSNSRSLSLTQDINRAQRETHRQRSVRERTEGLIHTLPVGIVVVDRRYDIQIINAAARRFLGIHTTAVGDDLIHLTQSIAANRLRALIDAASRGETSSGYFDTNEQSPANENFSLQITCLPQRPGGDGQPIESVLVQIANDSAGTDQRRTLERTLEEQRLETERLKVAVDRLSVTNVELLAANQELVSTNAELRSVNEELLVSHEEVQAATEEVETLNEEMQASNEELETLNEELQATIEELNITKDDLESRGLELQEIAVILEDQRLEAEAAGARISAVLAGMSDAVVVVARDARIHLTNTAYETMFGPHGLDTLLTSEGERVEGDAHPLRRAARGEVFVLEFVLTAQDESRRWFEAHGQPIQSEVDGEGVIVIRETRERTLHRLQDEFLSLAGHELRNPLTALSGYLSLLDRRLPDTPEAEGLRALVNPAREQVGRLDRLVGELVEVTRLQSGKFRLQTEVVDLSALANRTVEMGRILAPRQSLKLHDELGEAWVRADEARIEQVLLNLITNAARYAAESARIDVHLKSSGDCVDLTVQDYGPGIPSADLPKIFTRFFQSERAGRPVAGGLGLFISHQIATAHGGTLTVQSDEDKGAAFTLRLPPTEPPR